MDSDIRQKMNELIGKAKIGMLTTMTADGEHYSRPMQLQDNEFDGDLWFFTYAGSNKLTDIEHNPEVNVSFSDKGADLWVSIAGRAEALQDSAKAEELWTTAMKAWFPDGPQTEGLTLIKVHAHGAQYWDTPNNKAVQLFGVAKATLTGQAPKPGDNQKIDL